MMIFLHALIGAIVIGFALCVMHLLGMLAKRILKDTEFDVPNVLLGAFAIVILTVFFLVCAIIGKLIYNG